MEAAENVGTEPKAAVPEAAAVEDGRERHDRELKDGLHPLKVSNFFLLCSRWIGELFLLDVVADGENHLSLFELSVNWAFFELGFVTG